MLSYCIRGSQIQRLKTRQKLIFVIKQSLGVWETKAGRQHVRSAVLLQEEGRERGTRGYSPNHFRVRAQKWHMSFPIILQDILVS